MTSSTKFKLAQLFALIVFKTSCMVVISADSEEDCSKEADQCACEYKQAILPAVNGIGGLQVCEVFNLLISCIELEPSSLSQEARYDRAGHIQKDLEDLGFQCNMCNLQACHQTYLNDVAEPLKQRERLQTCRVYGRLQWCVDQLDCDLGGGAKQEILETVYSELNRKGLRCVQEDESSKHDALDKHNHVEEVSSNEHASCLKHISVCNNTYVHEVHKSTTKEHSRHTKDREKTFCPIFERYAVCLKGTTCDSRKPEVLNIITHEYKELLTRGIPCGNGASSHHQENGIDRPSPNTFSMVLFFGLVMHYNI